MKRQIVEFLFFIVLLCSCEFKKTYKYVEIVEEKGILGGTETKEKDVKKIRAANDTTAYLEAYTDFCISLKVNKDMTQSLGEMYTTPVGFKLFNSKGEEITNNVFFANRAKREEEIKDQIFTEKNTIQEAVDKNKTEKSEEFKKTAKVDSIRVKELEKYFRKRTDEFSNDAKVWYEPKSAPQFTNRNGLYCYFQTEKGIPGNLRFRLQYYSDNWLFFKSVQFSIDGKAFEFAPARTETDSGDGGHIWEWFDQSLTDSEKELINALANAKSAKMKLIGRQYYNIKTISVDQINSIKHVLDLYHALGGKY